MSSRRALNAALVRAAKDRPCADCGRSFPSQAMDLDHVTSTKRGNVSDLLDLPEVELRAEIACCEVVCAVCHRLRTTARRIDVHEALADDAELASALSD